MAQAQLTCEVAQGQTVDALFSQRAFGLVEQRRAQMSVQDTAHGALPVLYAAVADLPGGATQAITRSAARHAKNVDALAGRADTVQLRSRSMCASFLTQDRLRISPHCVVACRYTRRLDGMTPSPSRFPCKSEAIRPSISTPIAR